MTGRDIALAAAGRAIEKKALEPVVIDMQRRSSYADYLVIVSGRSERHLQGIAEAIVDGMDAGGVGPLAVEGAGSHWVILDYGDVVVHLFHHAVREFYDLEGLWVDAPRLPLEVPPESRLSAADAY